MTQHRKHRGYNSQHLVAGYLRANGFPYAESTGAGRTGTDITGCVGLDWEIKARRALNLAALMRQMDERALHGVLAQAVIRPDGMGPATVHLWPTVTTLADHVALLRAAGYGMPPKEDT